MVMKINAECIFCLDTGRYQGIFFAIIVFFSRG